MVLNFKCTTAIFLLKNLFNDTVTSVGTRSRRQSVWSVSSSRYGQGRAAAGWLLRRARCGKSARGWLPGVSPRTGTEEGAGGVVASGAG